MWKWFLNKSTLSVNWAASRTQYSRYGWQLSLEKILCMLKTQEELAGSSTQTLGKICALLKKLLEAVEVNSTTWLKPPIPSPTISWIIITSSDFKSYFVKHCVRKKCAPPTTIYFFGIEWKLHSRKYKYLQNIMDELLQNNNTAWKPFMKTLNVNSTQVVYSRSVIPPAGLPRGAYIIRLQVQLDYS